MKYLKKYKLFEDTVNIEEVCEQYGIENYTVNNDNTVDVDGNVYFRDDNIKLLPVNFNIVNGYFKCYNCNLTSLKGAPKSVGNTFNCDKNKLTSLQYSPEVLESGDYDCNSNIIKSLKYITSPIPGDLNVEYNKLTSLEFCPIVQGTVYCSNNEINTFINFYFYKDDIIFKNNPICDIYDLFKDIKLIDYTRDYNFEANGKISLSLLNKFLIDWGHEYDGNLREYFNRKKYNWKLESDVPELRYSEDVKEKYRFYRPRY
jgi:hypothetical protein